MRINMKYNVIYVKGTVPGATNTIVRIFDTILPLRWVSKLLFLFYIRNLKF